MTDTARFEEGVLEARRSRTLASDGVDEDARL